MLMGVSAPPLYWMQVEKWLGFLFDWNYQVQWVHDATRVEECGHAIQLEDDLGQGTDEKTRTIAHLRVIVDGRLQEQALKVVARTFYDDSNRYFTWATLGILREREGSKLFVIQRLPAPQPAPDRPDDSALEPGGKEHYRWRILFLGCDGQISTEQFTFAERSSPVYRAVLAGRTSPVMLGFRSGVWTVWPTLWYPLLYPWLSGLIGCILLIAAAWSWYRSQGEGRQEGEGR